MAMVMMVVVVMMLSHTVSRFLPITCKLDYGVSAENTQNRPLEKSSFQTSSSRYFV